ncbi:TPA: hypothetical protein ACGOTT_000118 [Streptococcus suis]
MDNLENFILFLMGVASLLALTALWLVLKEEEFEDSQIILQEDTHWTEFLETRQAINEDFLVAQKKLLENLNHERRKF